MKHRIYVAVFIILASQFVLPIHQVVPRVTRVFQQPTAFRPAVSIWDPNVHSGNITDANLSLGSKFTVSLNLTDAPMFDTYTVRFEYNPAILQIGDTSLNGTIFYPNIAGSFVSAYAPGAVTAFVHGDAPFSGSGVLLYLNFTVLLVSVSILRIVEVDLSLNGQTPTALNAEGCFNNRPSIQPTVSFTESPSPNYNQTSLYMVGKVAVGIIIAQSTSGDYNWTDAQVSQTISGIEQAMSFWASQQRARDLTFYYDVHIRAPTSYQPIQIPLGQDSVWIQDVMNRMGYPGDAYTATLAYDNAIRAANHTDWAFSIFVADSNTSVNLGNFPDGEYAEAYIGGPYFAMSRDSVWAYNAAQYFEAVPAHETGHIFGATDEYLYFLQSSGYLITPDAPGSYGIMDLNSLYVSVSTAAQVGLVDCNGDGVPDLVETRPAISLNTTQTIIAGSTATIDGTAVVPGYPRYTSDIGVSVAKISGVQFSVDQGPAVNATPANGSFNQTLEHFSLTLTGLSPGTHTIYVTATTSFGENDTTSFTVNVLATGASASLIKWKALPLYHYLDLSSGKPVQFLEDVNVTGGPVYMYQLFQITSRNFTFILSTGVSIIDPGVYVSSMPWRPPDQSRTYLVQASLYYSPSPATAGWTLGGSKQFAFRTAA